MDEIRSENWEWTLLRLAVLAVNDIRDVMPELDRSQTSIRPNSLILIILMPMAAIKALSFASSYLDYTGQIVMVGWSGCATLIG